MTIKNIFYTIKSKLWNGDTRVYMITINNINFTSLANATLGHNTAQNQATTEQTQDTNQATGGLFGDNMFGIVIMYLAIFGLAWLFIIRPQRKRQKAQQQIQQSLKVGDNIVTNSGMYGKIVDVGVDVFIVEFGTNKGIRIPVAKQEILTVKEPSLN